MQKMKDCDEFFRGSSSTGEAAFYNFAMAFNLCEVLTYSIDLVNILDSHENSISEASTAIPRNNSMKIMSNI